MDSRTSDAVALALRFNCPIYIAEEIIVKAGIVIKENEYEDVENTASQQPGSRKTSPPELSELSISELKVKLEEAIKAEDYERAAFIKDEIDKREGKGKE